MPKTPQPKKTSSQAPIEPVEFRVEVPNHPPELADERMARVFAVYEAERQGMRLDVPFSVDVNNWPSGGSRVYTFSQDNNAQGNPVINEQIKKWAEQTLASVQQERANAYAPVANTRLSVSRHRVFSDAELERFQQDRQHARVSSSIEEAMALERRREIERAMQQWVQRAPPISIQDIRTDWRRPMPEKKKKIDKASGFVKIATEDETKPLRRITL